MKIEGKIKNILETKEVSIMNLVLTGSESEYGVLTMSPDGGKNWSIVSIEGQQDIDDLYIKTVKVITSNNFSWCDLLGKYHYVAWLKTISIDNDCIFTMFMNTIQNLIKGLYVEYKQD